MEESVAMNTPEETITAATKNEYQCPRIVEKIERALDQSIKLNFSPSCRCIYRVPDLLRKLNEEAYTPQLISIGPFHYRSPKLQSMENYKLRFLKDLMKRADIKSKDLVSIVKGSEQRVRECYEGTIEIESDDFITMILVDACFIIEFFLRYLSSTESELSTDHGNLIELKPWMIYRMKLDLILLENQIPFFIIKELYDLLPLEPPSVYPSGFLDISIIYFKECLDYDPPSGEISHFVDLLRYFYLRTCPSLPKRSFKGIMEMYSASQLAEAGLKFKPISEHCSLIALKFNEGVLEIPKFIFDDVTEIYGRNLMALEQCHYPKEAYVTDYFIMLDFLIKTDKDVDLLVQKEILVNETGTYSRPVLPSNLCTGISHWGMNDDYYDLCTQLVEFRRKHWYVILKTSLKKDYFRTTWMGAATVGAIILLILTLIQTICTVISIFK